MYMCVSVFVSVCELLNKCVCECQSDLTFSELLLDFGALF